MTLRWPILLLSLLACLTRLAVSLKTEDNHANHWEYSGKHGEKTWESMHKNCRGKHQSPIDIQTKTAVLDKSLKLVFNNYHEPVRGREWLLVNNGHSAKLMPNTKDMDVLNSTITGSVLNGQIYRLFQFHFHWHEDNEKGTEHAINGRHFAAELHFVHKNIKYHTIAEASAHKDGFAVLSVLFKVARKNNLYLHPFANKLPLIEQFPSNTSFDEDLDITNLLPNDLQTFYTYQGSFTTPPCDEAVTWIVFKEFAGIKQSQLKQFRKLHGAKDLIVQNIRSTQRLNDRVVYTTDSNSSSKLSGKSPFQIMLVLLIVLHTSY